MMFLKFICVLVPVNILFLLSIYQLMTLDSFQYLAIINEQCCYEHSDTKFVWTKAFICRELILGVELLDIGDREIGSPKCPWPIHGNCYNVTFQNKTYFMHVISHFNKGDYLGFFRWAQCKHRGPYQRDVGCRIVRVRKEMWWWKQRSEEERETVSKCYTADFEEGRKDHEPRNAGLLKTGKVGKWTLP